MKFKNHISPISFRYSKSVGWAERQTHLKAPKQAELTCSSKATQQTQWTKTIYFLIKIKPKLIRNALFEVTLDLYMKLNLLTKINLFLSKIYEK